MRYVTLAVIGAASVAVLGACEPASAVDIPTPDAPMPKRAGATLPYGLSVWTDPDTGCQYFVPYQNSEYGLMPRTSADGFHQVCRDTGVEVAQ